MEEFGAILAVDDSKANLDILLRILDNFDVIVAINGFRALEIAKNQKISLILLDIAMPQIDGFEVCRRLKQDPKTKDIPVIFLTSSTDNDSIGMAYDVGGDDYISRPLKIKEVLARIKTQLQLRKNLKNLEFLASYDPMTEIFNRRKFFELATVAFANSDEKLCAGMIDIDKFKNINDTFGHSTGDLVIKTLAQTIQKNLCSEAIFGRIGGEEFAIVCDKNTKEGMYLTLEKIKNEIEKIEFEAKGEIFRCTISAGISQKTQNTKNIDELLRRADVALYEAKRLGRNKIIVK